jgi:hypothetical protein
MVEEKKTEKDYEKIVDNALRNGNFVSYREVSKKILAGL